MRKIQILGAFIAVLAFSALAVASAGATLWLKEGKSLTSPVASTSSGTIVLVHKGGSTGNSRVECTGVFVGKTGAGAKDEITLVENLTHTEKDLVVCKTLEGCFTSTPTVHAVGLPWATELVLETRKHEAEEIKGTWDKQSAAGEGPGYEVECLFGIKVTCRGTEFAFFLANDPTGALFDYLGAISGEAKCSDGGIGTIEGKGLAEGFTVS